MKQAGDETSLATSSKTQNIRNNHLATICISNKCIDVSTEASSSSHNLVVDSSAMNFTNKKTIT